MHVDEISWRIFVNIVKGIKIMKISDVNSLAPGVQRSDGLVSQKDRWKQMN
jgi:hypothetical protein